MRRERWEGRADFTYPPMRRHHPANAPQARSSTLRSLWPGGFLDEFADGNDQVFYSVAAFAIAVADHVLRLAPSLVQFFVAAFLPSPNGFDMTVEITFADKVFFPVFPPLFDVCGIQKFEPLDAFVYGH